MLLDFMCDRIEGYVRAQVGLESPPGCHNVGHVVGDAFAGMIHDPLKVHL
jgi:hypothetical protein